MIETDNRKLFLVKRYNTGKALNIGCGWFYIKNAINLDINRKLKCDIIGDFHYLPFRNHSFDVIFCFDIIEHTKHPEILLAEIERTAKENVIIGCLDFDLCQQNWLKDSSHEFFFNKKIFRELLSNRGYVCFSLRKSMLLAVRIPKPFDRQLCFLYCIYKKILSEVKNLLNLK